MNCSSALSFIMPLSYIEYHLDLCIGSTWDAGGFSLKETMFASSGVLGGNTVSLSDDAFHLNINVWPSRTGR